MNKLNFIAFCCISTLLACSSSPSRQVLIMGRGAITAQENNITMKEGSGYSEETVEVSGEKATSWNVTTPAGKTTVNIPAEKGFYVLNLKNDTIVGSQQILGKDLSTGRTMTQEELKIKVDSLTKLTTGSNVSPESHNYIILPNQLVKISSNTEAKIFGPFKKIPGTLEADNGKTPELYKFYTNSEMRQLIASLKKMTF